MQKGQDEETWKNKVELTGELLSAVLDCSLLLMKPEAHFSKLEFQLLPYQTNKKKIKEICEDLHLLLHLNNNVFFLLLWHQIFII